MKRENFSKIFIRLAIRLFKARDGVAVMEYGLLVALIALVLLVSLKALGISLSTFMTFVADSMSDAQGS